MVSTLNIGVIGIQGAVFEHIFSMQNALKNKKITGKIFVIKQKEEIKNIDALILPGGESTTISRVLYKSEMHGEILKRIKENSLPVMGTCAGCAILSSKLTDDSKDVRILNAIDMQVTRNAFGRQKHSFEKKITINGFSKPYNAVFIRAPQIEKVWGKCKILAEIDEKIVMVRQNKLLAISFHPELTKDYRIHEYFLDII